MSKSSFLKEFKDFAVKGNAIDMAIGVIIGGAFGKVVSSIVNDLIMPPIGWLIGGINFTDLKFKLPVNPLEPDLAPAVIAYGNFIQTCIDFIIIALCIFILLKAMLKMSNKKQETAAPAAPAAPAPTKEEVLLTEIRDLLKEKSAK